ncbi:IS200/IS605 family transposase [Portibacter lacus]|uniref:Transposase n=1 Tax=Portibacter lacus TaxID=1099794 RepID=A0AA37SS47_9BACT|nr:IS200/IS605 family transposase [Portibacter lacus]GLR18409.1 transposase [Portibacter lacus]
MANTYTQINIQLVFAVKGRQNLIIEKHRERLEKFMCGIIRNNKSKPLAIYCNPDHTHVFIGLHPSIAISDITREIKSSSSKFINDEKWIRGKFAWQEGFGAFSYAKSQIGLVVKYILNQPEHHKKTSFREEYIEFLNKFEIKYKEEYLFDFND